jgi:hypothetical protein
MSLFIGAVLLGLAVSMAFLPSGPGEDYTLIAVGDGFLFGIPGAILAINGATKYAESKFAANNFESRRSHHFLCCQRRTHPLGPLPTWARPYCHRV